MGRDNGRRMGEGDEMDAYRVAFTHQVVEFIVAVGGGSGRKGDSLVFCGSSPHYGSD